MRTYTLADIRALKLCSDPVQYAPEDWSGTLLDILKADQVPVQDRIWVTTQLLDDRTNRLFAVYCARQALALIESPDPRSVAACDVAERYAEGKATQEELAAAETTAGAAAWTVRAAAWDAAWTVRAAVWDAAWTAAWATAWAARTTAWDAAGAAAGAARTTAWDAAGAARTARTAAAQQKQLDWLIQVVQSETEATRY